MHINCHLDKSIKSSYISSFQLYKFDINYTIEAFNITNYFILIFFCGGRKLNMTKWFAQYMKLPSTALGPLLKSPNL